MLRNEATGWWTAIGLHRVNCYTHALHLLTTVVTRTLGKFADSARTDTSSPTGRASSKSRDTCVPLTATLLFSPLGDV